MKINKIKFQNFRIYKGENEILFAPNPSKNISIIAGKNGFGKTTFLTSLIWVFYGKMMSEVEDKYKKDDIQYKLRNLAEAIVDIAPYAAEKIASMTPLAPISESIGKSVEYF